MGERPFGNEKRQKHLSRLMMTCCGNHIGRFPPPTTLRLAASC
jgi:hypothetical protein